MKKNQRITSSEEHVVVVSVVARLHGGGGGGGDFMLCSSTYSTHIRTYKYICSNWKCVQVSTCVNVLIWDAGLGEIDIPKRTHVCMHIRTCRNCLVIHKHFLCKILFIGDMMQELLYVYNLTLPYVYTYVYAYICVYVECSDHLFSPAICKAN